MDPTSRAQVEATIRYLTAAEGGRRAPVFNGYRGQFHYEIEPESVHDAFQYFPDVPGNRPVLLGTTVKAVLCFFADRWRGYHSKRIKAGTRFQTQEGRKIVGRGVITGIREQE